MTTVSALYKTLKEMRCVYPFKDEKTIFRMARNMDSCSDTVVEIKTVDEDTGIEVIMAKDTRKEDTK